MFNQRLVELGQKNPMACLIKDLLKYTTGLLVLYLIHRYVEIDRKYIEYSSFTLSILFIATILHKYIIDRIIGAGLYECPPEIDERSPEENMGLKNNKKKEGEMPPIPEVNKAPQPQLPSQPTPSKMIHNSFNTMQNEHIPMMPNQMEVAPPQFSMGGYQTLY